MPRMVRWTLLALLAATPAHAVDLHYDTYAAGVNVLDIDASFDLGPDSYRATVTTRTVGAFSLIMRGQQRSTADGRFNGARSVPNRFFSSGTLNGKSRVTQVDYRNGQPDVRQLVPPNVDEEREAVPVSLTAGTVDTLSASAGLLHQVNTTRRCDGETTTYDGRRLATLQGRTSGMQTLDPTSRSSFSGPALRCDFVGRQVGGFKLDEDRARLARPQNATVWFAAITPDGPMVPVRIAFSTRFFGDATMYLAPKG